MTSRAIGQLLCSSFILVAMVIVPAMGETIDELKGLSLSLEWHSSVGVRRPALGEPTVSINETWNMKLYISMLGRVFNYNDGQIDQAEAAPNTIKVYDLDKSSTTDHCGRRTVWTLIDNHLSKITKFVEGFKVESIIVDTRNMICYLSLKDYPDLQTGQVVSVTFASAKTSCDRRIIVSETVRDYKCSVTRGNIFGNDH
jgi:hypothetical protein